MLTTCYSGMAGKRYKRLGLIGEVFKNGPNEICLRRPYHFKFFKGCLLQISLGPFLSTLSQLSFAMSNSSVFCPDLRMLQFSRIIIGHFLKTFFKS